MDRVFRVSAAEIQREAVRRGIQGLLHFTQIWNLHGIVTHGLLSRTALNERGLDAYGSSGHRRDLKDQAISLSISAVYPKMFMAKQQSVGHPHWVIILLDPSILWTHRCRFLCRNAGKKEIKNHRGFLGGPWGFSEIFTEDGRPSGMPNSLPTYPDAEVQVYEPILPEMILEAWVDRPDYAEVVQAELNRLPGAERNVIKCSSWPIWRNGGREWLIPTENWEWSHKRL
ncbi:DarT ssDNA thymidine ADP-ribosyltransferase family protein [Mesorhizobium sp. SP-1A]|uniref:DarT ssDNA thymidine ADP-ribosyltransferase family protein n=1 Tax=Mesorhizobium sp. SP-1A TaxID=3077840 RepID=UPI0028F6DF68|nr:DarT ssDNA thymidine ADP-ribosyltransferase family protein [Mesorhizobium sp. SP-1A]